MQRLGVLLLVVVCACGDNIKGAPGDANPDTPGNLCGNGVLDGLENCDNGADNGSPGGNCDVVCHWICLEDLACTDNDPCNGDETCADHRCVVGTPESDGTTCGTGKLCRNAVCTDAVCGDQFTTAPAEECDDANSTQNDGCDTNCKFSCISTDTARNCTPADACAGQGTCNDATHICAAGTPLADNTACGSGGYCKVGVCTQPMCGNGQTEPGEDCDDGASNGMANDGCNASCHFACVNAATDCAAASFCQMNTCSVGHVCTPVADPAKNGMTCGTNLVCNAGACVAPSAVCGNGTVETGEQCDFGSGVNGPGTGCETNCQFSCQSSPTDTCDDGNACNGTESCGAVTVSGHAGKKCSSTAALAQGATCGTMKICLSSVCVNSVCGDNWTDPMRGETCDPPSSTCDAACHTIVCGDATRAGSEQCDDGNLTNLDGCDSGCKFEQSHRVITLSLVNAGTIPGGVDTYCTANKLGNAITGGTARTTIANALTNGIADGSITIDLKAYNLDDLSGTNDNALTLGTLTGAHATGTTTYNGASDMDWWYTTSANVIDGARNALTQVPASIAAKTLNGGPSEIKIQVSLAGVPATLDMLNAKLTSNIGLSTKPATSTGGTPGHLAAEHLDPTLTSFATMTAGKLCGDVTAESLKNVPAPAALVGCTLTTCSQCYTATNTLLDIVVSGCGTIIGTQIAASQPDHARVSGTYVFQVGAGHVVTGCTKNGQPAVLSACLTDAAYSSYFRFTTDRVIAK